MIELVDSMLTYLKTAETSSFLDSAEKLVGGDILRTISIRIVDWLKVENIRKVSKPLSLNYNYPWCKNLKRLVEEDIMFAKAFVIEGYELSYNSTVNEESRKKAKLLAVERYNPPVMT